MGGKTYEQGGADRAGVALARDIRQGAGGFRRRGRGATLRRGLLLARPRRLHLEHQDARGPRRDRGDARRPPRRRKTVAMGDQRRGERGRRDHARLVHVRDRGRARRRHRPPQGREMLDAADLHDRAQRLRGEEGAAARQGRAARRVPGTRDLGRAQGARGGGARRQPPALLPDRRRRPGGRRARRAPEAPRRSDADRRQARAAGRLNGASATDRSACTIPSGTIICPISPSPTTGRSSRPRTRSAIGSRATRR